MFNSAILFSLLRQKFILLALLENYLATTFAVISLPLKEKMAKDWKEGGQMLLRELELIMIGR
jgi:hypothetical protein